jgi:hypothetical protein
LYVDGQPAGSRFVDARAAAGIRRNVTWPLRLTERKIHRLAVGEQTATIEVQ